MEKTNPKNKTGRFEIYFSFLGSVICFITTYFIWRSFIPYQSFWLLPGFYLIELFLGAAICFLAFLMRYRHASTICWIYSGILCVFIFLASFSVGLLYVPVFLVFAMVSIFSTIRLRSILFPKLVMFLCAGLIQLALMLFIIWAQ